MQSRRRRILAELTSRLPKNACDTGAGGKRLTSEYKARRAAIADVPEWHSACLVAISKVGTVDPSYEETMMTSMTSSSIGPESASSFDQQRSGNGSTEPSPSTSTTVDRIASGAHQAVDRIAAAANSAADHLNVKGEDLMAAKDRWTQVCGTYVKDNPLTALGIAAAVGFLISRWIR